MVTKLQLSRDYLYVPITDMNVNPASISLQRIAFMDTPGGVPLDGDWNNAILVDDAGDPQWVASIGISFVILVGPLRGDAVTSEDLPVGTYQVWVELKITGSDERPVRIAGTLEVV